MFTQAVIELSTQQTDASGKKLFRLDPKGKHAAMFDPYYIVKRKEESAQQTAYDQFYKTNPNCNNIVGDYKSNYKYQTGVNKEIWQAFAQSALLTEIVSKTVKETLSWMLDQGEETPEKAFKMALFPPTTMHMGLKLLIIICQNCESQDMMDVLRSVLTDDLLTRSFSMDAGVCKD